METIETARQKRRKCLLLLPSGKTEFLGSVNLEQCERILEAGGARGATLHTLPRQHGRGERVVLLVTDPDTFLLWDRHFKIEDLLSSKFHRLVRLTGPAWVGIDGRPHDFAGHHKAFEHKAA